MTHLAVVSITLLAVLVLKYGHCFYHIRALKHIRDSLDSSTIRTIAAVLVSCHLSWLDYANSVLYSIPAKYISRLQRTQNTLARVVAGNRTPGSHLATLSKLHWLPVHDRIMNS